MTALFFLALVGGLVFLGDELVAWMLPAVPARLGTVLLLIATVLGGGLALTPTRTLAQAVILGIAKALGFLVQAVAYSTVAASKIICASGRLAWRRLWSGGSS